MKNCLFAALVVVFFIPQTGLATAGKLDDLCSDIRGKAPDAKGRFDAVVMCITGLAKELEARPKVPSGAVVGV